MSDDSPNARVSSTDGTRTLRVEMLTRVEGEGRLRLRVKEGRVEEATLAIFEPPRFFEAFLVGRSIYEVPDIVARICGICPVTYQITSLRALEGILGLEPGRKIRRFRRLMYCAEWIQSHALHVFLLHAPDFLGYPNAIEMARDHRELVEMGLRMKKAGNTVLEVMGGRAIHPVSARIGGFTKVPSIRKLQALLPELEWGLDAARETVRVVAGLPMLGVEPPFVEAPIRSGEGRGATEAPRGLQYQGRPDQNRGGARDPHLPDDRAAAPLACVSPNRGPGEPRPGRRRCCAGGGLGTRGDGRLRRGDPGRRLGA